MMGVTGGNHSVCLWRPRRLDHEETGLLLHRLLMMRMNYAKIEVPRLGVGDGSSSYLFGLCFKVANMLFCSDEIYELFYLYYLEKLHIT